MPHSSPVSARRRHALDLFADLGPTYDRVGAALSFGQDPRWRRMLVDRLPRDRGHVLDVAAGTGLVSAELVGRGFRVTLLDQSEGMLAVARRRLGGRTPVVVASADAIPVPDRSFDHLTFTYLLRYVDDPAATMVELARVVRPGGTVAMLEFGVPRGAWRLPWEAYVRVALPAAGRVISPAWGAVGSFLGDSIRSFDDRYPTERLRRLWLDAGIEVAGVLRPSLGGGTIVWGRRR